MEGYSGSSGDRRVRVKICGITNGEDAHCAVELGADALGFVFYPESPRYVSPPKVRDIVAKLPPFVTPIGVFVDEAEQRVEDVLAETGIQVVQLHGDEPPHCCEGFDVKVIKAFRVQEDFDPVELGAYRVDAYLLDAYDERRMGGTGRTFNWDLALPAKGYGRIILSGGLNPDNVGRAIEIVRPYGVDVSSGVEREPGRKDLGKLRAFMLEVRDASLRI